MSSNLSIEPSTPNYTQSTRGTQQADGARPEGEGGWEYGRDLRNAVE